VTHRHSSTSPLPPVSFFPKFQDPSFSKADILSALTKELIVNRSASLEIIRRPFETSPISNAKLAIAAVRGT
jgi:hypothetical protein